MSASRSLKALDVSRIPNVDALEIAASYVLGCSIEKVYFYNGDFWRSIGSHVKGKNAFLGVSRHHSDAGFGNIIFCDGEYYVSCPEPIFELDITKGSFLSTRVVYSSRDNFNYTSYSMTEIDNALLFWHYLKGSRACVLNPLPTVYNKSAFSYSNRKMASSLLNNFLSTLPSDLVNDCSPAFTKAYKNLESGVNDSIDCLYQMISALHPEIPSIKPFARQPYQHPEIVAKDFFALISSRVYFENPAAMTADMDDFILDLSL